MKAHVSESFSYRLHHRDRAQSAMYDAIIFFILIMIASTVVLVFSTYSARSNTVTNISHEQEFSDVLLLTLTRSTISNATYTMIGANVTTVLSNRYVSDLIVTDLVLRTALTVDTLSIHEGTEDRIKSVADNLSIPSHKYILECTLELKNGSRTQVNIRADNVMALPENRQAANLRMEIATPYEATVNFRLYTWKS